MTDKIDRFNGEVKAFASEYQGTERTTFGTINTSNELTDQQTSGYLRGWGIVGANEDPALEDFNAAMYTATQYIAYLHQMGIPEWNAAQEYPTEGAQVVHSLNAWTRGPDWVLGDEPGVSDSTRWKMNGESNEYTLYSGVPNDIALSTAYGPVRKSLRVGDKVRFTATANNTGATTINLDGLGAVSCITITGVDLPPSYIRDDIHTEAFYNGVNWVVDRVTESNSNALGYYTRFADGTLLMNGNSSADPLAITASVDGVFFGTLPILFPIESSSSDNAAVEASVSASVTAAWANVNSITTTGCSLIALCNVSKTVTTTFKWSSKATWY